MATIEIKIDEQKIRELLQDDWGMAVLLDPSKEPDHTSRDDRTSEGQTWRADFGSTWTEERNVSAKADHSGWHDRTGGALRSRRHLLWRPSFSGKSDRRRRSC